MPPDVTYPVTVCKPHLCPFRSSLCGSSWEYVTGMVTRIHGRRPRRLFLREHRKAKGISAEIMAGRLGIERESVLRLEREALTRANGQRQAEYADILQIEPEALWRAPNEPSLDSLVEQAPPDKRELAEDMARNLRRYVSGKG